MKKLQNFQKKADKRWGFDFQIWDEIVGPQKVLPGMFENAHDPIIDGTLRRLEYVALALAGEVGELANETKKVRRKILEGEDLKTVNFSQMQDEVADVLAYLLKLCNLMEWDLQKIYLSKMARNDARFQKKNQKTIVKKK
ncbi:MAG: MazG nucleotide pyrophosphohydrolase domain-containing protein [Bdellovibrionota bacterium]